MNSESLTQLEELSKEHKSALRNGGIYTVSQFILASPKHLENKCKLTALVQKDILDIVCRVHGSKPRPLLDLIGTEPYTFTTGEPLLDDTLGNGIRTSMLWEIVGESAAGKSQLALQLCLSVQLPRQSGGLFGSACFLTTSASLPTTRLHEIIADRPIFQTQGCSLDNIHTMEAPTVSILLHILHHILPQFIQSVASSRPVKLLVIDSIAELFHLDEKTSTKSLVDRAKELTSITTTLHALLNEHKIAVVVINEVVDVFAHTSNNDGSANPNSQLLYSEHSHLFNRPYAVPGGSSKEASLGLVWANQINARIFLSRTRRRIRISEISSSKRAKIGETYLKPQSLNDEEDVLLRRLNVVFSSVGPPAALDYIITAGGFVVQQVVEQTLSQSYRPSELSLTPSPLVSSPEDPGMVTQFGGEPSLDKSRNILESEQVFPTASQISPLDLGEAVVNEADDEVVPSSQDEESIL